jgi:hypothetical protein
MRIIVGLETSRNRPYFVACDAGADMDNSEIVARLDVLIKLQAAALTASIDSLKDKIIFLDRSGLNPSLIAEVLKTSSNHVNVTLSKERKKGGK